MTRRLHGYSRPSGRLLSDSHPQLVKKIPPLQPRGGDVPVPMPLLRSDLRLSSIHESLRNSVGMGAITEDKTHPRSRRLADLSQIQRRLQTSCPSSSSVCEEPGGGINEKKSDLTPAQATTYLGMSLNSKEGMSYPSQDRMNRLLCLISDFTKRHLNQRRSGSSYRAP